MFGSLFGKKKRAPQLKAKKLSTATAESILSVVGSRSIPLMPGAAQKAFQLSTDPKAEARDFVEVIESDEGLAARIIKIANSVFFERGTQAKTIDQAVTVIGINELRSLLSATTLSEIFPSNHPLRAQFWANDVAVGLIARRIAERSLPAKKEVAFLAGLMHDVGKLLLIQRATEQYGKAVALVEQEGRPFHEAEGELFAFDHTEVGQLIGERWNFTPDLIDVIRHHHEPIADATAGELTLPQVIQLADLLAHALGLGHTPKFIRLKNKSLEQVDQILLLLGIPPTEKKSFLSSLQQTFDSEFDLYKGKGA
jgi:putative nucleotidyltransferase with HDIG domain